MIGTKKCTKCGEVKNAVEFYKRVASKDGLMPICKSCSRDKNKKWQQENHEKVREYKRKWDSDNIEKRRRYDKRWKQKDVNRYLALHLSSAKKYQSLNAEKVSARYHVKNAIDSGKLERLPCEVCGSAYNIEAHHEDYSKPLDIIWMCRVCHNSYHTNIRRASNG